MFFGLFCRVGSRWESRWEKPFQKDHVSKILLFQLGGIGDVLLTFPVIERVREAFPDSRLSVLTEFGKELFDLYPDSEAISTQYRYEPKGKHRSLTQKYRFFRSVGREGCDLILNTNRGNILVEASIMAYVMGAPHRLGFYRDGAGFLNTIRAEFQYDRYILEQNLDLLLNIGVPKKSGEEIPLRVPEQAKNTVQMWFQSHAVTHNDRVVVVHPGAKFDAAYKIWPLENFTELICEMISRYRAKVILIGDRTERTAASVISAGVQSANLVDRVGRTTIVEMAALIDAADLFIGNDSGPLHVAVALKKPCVGIFLATSPEQLLPADSDRIFVKRATNRALYAHQPLFRYKPSDRETLPRLPTSEVLETVDRILRRMGTRGSDGNGHE
jgi:ADP-heptose:LPS heptosyltransferase